MTFPRRMTQWLASTLQPQCVFCGEKRHAGLPLCQQCHDELPWLPDTNNIPIDACDTCISAFAYQPPISNLLLGIKFGKNLRELSSLGELTAACILSQMAQVPDAILPVPLHTARLHKRGFNQALELARPLAKQLGIPLLTHAVKRGKFTLPQTELDSQQRQQNLSQAFQIAAPLPYQRVAIFDDVITTGATSRELARLLRAHGVQHIDVWSCARPILRQKQELTPQISYH
jgi:ComF family protein